MQNMEGLLHQTTPLLKSCYMHEYSRYNSYAWLRYWYLYQGENNNITGLEFQE